MVVFPENPLAVFHAIFESSTSLTEMFRLTSGFHICLVGVLTLAGALPGHTKELEIPELGIKFTDIPDNTSAPNLNDRPNGYEATARFGNAIISVYRFDDPEPLGSSISDASYRATVISRTDNPRKPRSAGGLTKVGGHEAWAFLESQRPAPPLPIVDYSCIAFVIVDQHLYRLTASVVTTGKKPPEFDAAIRAFETVSFELAQRPSRQIPESVAALDGKMPRFVLGEGLVYPAVALRLGEQGVVDIEFGIDARGRAKDMKELYATSKHLDQFIPETLRYGAFRVPADWHETGSDSKRFTIEFQFSISDSKGHCGMNGVAPRITGATVIGVCSRLEPPAKR